MAKRRGKFDLKGFMDFMAHETREVGYHVEGYINTNLLLTIHGHSAARILLPKFMKRWQRLVPGRLIIGLPSRDVIVGFSEDCRAVEPLAKQIYMDYQRYQNKLSPKLFVWQDGELKLYEKQFI